MSKFQNYLKTFDITSTLTEEDIDKTLALLQIYGPAVRRTASRIGEMEEECYEGRRQSISDFINLAIDYDRDTDRKRIADRLAEMGHSMQLLSVMEDALVLVKDTPPNGGTYFNILQARYAGIVHDGRNYMFFTMDEVALIDGLIATYFVAESVSESVRVRYYETHQHLQDNRTDYVDLRNIKEALFFLAPLFHGSIQFEKDIWSVIAKTQRLLKESSPVAE